MSKQKKHDQLGMNYSTASNRLVKDLLFNFICKTGENNCYRCQQPMTRENFSIDHKEPWLDSKKPVELFFNLNNISYSHLVCNSAAAKKYIKGCGVISSYQRGCRCDLCKAANAKRVSKSYNSELRKEKYKRTGN